MKRYLVTLSLAVLVSASAAAQHHYQQVLDTLQRRSTAYLAIQKEKSARQSETTATPLLADPSVSFDYLWASRTGEGNRWSASLSQELPLPGRYSSMRRIRSLAGDTIEAGWLLQRQRWMLEIQHLCAEIVYANMQLAHYDHCVGIARQVADAMSRRMELGDCGIIEYNRAQLELVALQNRQQMLQTQRDSRLQQLRTYNDNVAVTVADTLFPAVVLPADFSAWYDEVSRQAPERRMAAMHTDLHHEQYRLTRKESLPALTAGVVAEYEADCLFRGVALGVNIPLWNRRRQVSGARLAWQASQHDEQRVQMELYGRLSRLYAQVQTLSDEVQRLAAQCERYDSEALLLKSFLAGEISLESYLRQVEFFHDTEMAVIDARYALECAWLDLMSIKL